MIKKMLSKLFLAFAFSSAGITQIVFAQGTNKTPIGNTTIETQASPPKFKASVTEYYYNFEGTKAAKGNLYSFGETTLQMELLSLQYQVDADWTLMLLGTHLKNDVITNLDSFGVSSKDRSQGFGDTILSAMRPVYMMNSVLVLADLGLSLPTGSISEKNPSSTTAANYPYNMQMGSGTFDGLIGLTGLFLKPTYQLGTRFASILRTGQENTYGYHLGNQYRADAWADYPLAYGFSPRVIGYYKYRAAIGGQDSTFVRSAYTEFYYHEQINWDVSAAIKYQKALTAMFGVAAEAGIPLTQGSRNVDDIVVSTNYFGSLSINGVF